MTSNDVCHVFSTSNVLNVLNLRFCISQGSSKTLYPNFLKIFQNIFGFRSIFGYSAQFYERKRIIDRWSSFAFRTP